MNALVDTNAPFRFGGTPNTSPADAPKTPVGVHIRRAILWGVVALALVYLLSVARYNQVGADLQNYQGHSYPGACVLTHLIKANITASTFFPNPFAYVNESALAVGLDKCPVYVQANPGGPWITQVDPQNSFIGTNSPGFYFNSS